MGCNIVHLCLWELCLACKPHRKATASRDTHRLYLELTEIGCFAMRDNSLCAISGKPSSKRSGSQQLTYSMQICHAGLTTVFIIMLFVLVCTSTTSYAFKSNSGFPPINATLSFTAFCVAMLGLVLYFPIESLEHRTYGSGKAFVQKDT